jgi:hypothetical protein
MSNVKTMMLIGGAALVVYLLSGRSALAGEKMAGLKTVITPDPKAEMEKQALKNGTYERGAGGKLVMTARGKTMWEALAAKLDGRK